MARPQQGFLLISFNLLFHSVSQGLQSEQKCWLESSLLVYTHPMLFSMGFAVLPICLMLVSCLAHSSTLKIKAICSSDMSLHFIGLHGVQFTIICLSASWQCYYCIKKLNTIFANTRPVYIAQRINWQPDNERNFNQSTIFSKYLSPQGLRISLVRYVVITDCRKLKRMTLEWRPIA
jgi:hypothetical protein